MRVPESNVVPMRVPQAASAVEPTYLAMAMAQMHSEGRLFEPEQKPEAPNARPRP